jgi:hypothetical protein
MTNDFKLHEIVAIHLLNQLTKTLKPEIKIKKISDMNGHISWDVICYSSSTLPMVVELKSIYKDDKYTFGRIKKRKFDEIISLVQSEKAKKLNTQGFLFHIHPSFVDIINLSKVNAEFLSGSNPDIQIKKYEEEKSTAINSEELGVYDYLVFPMIDQFVERVKFNFNYNSAREFALKYMRKNYDSKIEFKDKK